mmetsp:Transcript_17174/g.44428  ORF Transcript_17174/g.44428 Transcript_17174/m.44428 type:complete len:455 (-) Transcript_17174:98-1462(-)
MTDNAERLYRGKVMLAPMVRAGMLPMRLLALHYGADTVYGEELIDLKVRKLVRRVNGLLGTVDFTLPDNESAVVFRTDREKEKGRLVFQLGSASAETAVAAARIVMHDVDGIDLNMGCPKKFSVQGGMGAKLLENSEVACEIISALRKAVPSHVVVSCKIRLLAETASTVALVRKLVAAGAQSVAVHLRQVTTSTKEPADWKQIRAIMEAVDVPIVANGSVFSHADIAAIRSAAGDEAESPRLGVMVARGALINPSLFSPEGESLELAGRRYLHYCALTDNPYQNTKYTLQRMMQENGARLSAQLGPQRTVHLLTKAKSHYAIAAHWCMHDREGRVPDGIGPELTFDGLTAAFEATYTALLERLPRASAPAADGDGTPDVDALHQAKRARTITTSDARVYTDEYILDGRGEMGHGVGSAVVVECEGARTNAAVQAKSLSESEPQPQGQAVTNPS